MKEIECEFHTANHHILREVANGLKIVVEFLVKVCRIKYQTVLWVKLCTIFTQLDATAFILLRRPVGGGIYCKAAFIGGQRLFTQ